MAKKKSAATHAKQKKGYKACPHCSKSIPARSGTCPECKKEIAPKKPKTPKKARKAMADGSLVAQLQAEKERLVAKIAAIDTILGQ